MKPFAISFSIETVTNRDHVVTTFTAIPCRDNFNFNIINRKKFKVRLINDLFLDKKFLISLFKKHNYMRNMRKNKCNHYKKDVIFPHISKKDFLKAKLLFPTLGSNAVRLVIKVKVRVGRKDKV